MKKTAFLKFIKLPFRAKSMFVEAVFWTFFFRIIIFIFPFRLWIKMLKVKKSQQNQSKTNAYEVIKKVYRAMRRSSVYMPFKQKCLIEALVMNKMLTSRNIKTSLSLGLAKGDNTKLLAHAWLVYEGQVISGKRNAGKYLEIKQF